MRESQWDIAVGSCLAFIGAWIICLALAALVVVILKWAF